jgi:proteasome accessory factor C
MDRFDRIFELNRILQAARYPVSRHRLEEELQCSRATVKRIIEDMRLYLNAPIVYDQDYHGYRYDQAAGAMYELPGLWFNASELHALLAVQQLLAGVQPGLLDQHLKPLHKRIDEILERQHLGSDGLANRVRILTMGARHGGAHFMVVAGALAQRQRLRIGYFNRGADRRGEREVSPQRLNYYRDNWYLDAWCHLRAGLRTFALDAIESATALETAAIAVPAAELERHFASSYGIFSGVPNQVAVLHFSPERARWVAKEQWHREQAGRFLVDGRYELRIPYNNPVELVMDVLKYGPDVEVVEPPTLRTAVRQRLHEALAQYASAPGRQDTATGALATTGPRTR